MSNDNADRRRGMSLASALGYKIAEQTYVPSQDLREGDKVIVFTNKGEPIMSGVIEKLSRWSTGGNAAIGEQIYDLDLHRFRYL